MLLYGQKNSFRKDNLMTKKKIWWTYDLPIEDVISLFPELSRKEVKQYNTITYVRQTDNRWNFRGYNEFNAKHEREVYQSWIDDDGYIEQNVEGLVGVI